MGLCGRGYDLTRRSQTVTGDSASGPQLCGIAVSLKVSFGEDCRLRVALWRRSRRAQQEQHFAYRI